MFKKFFLMFLGIALNAAPVLAASGDLGVDGVLTVPTIAFPDGTSLTTGGTASLTANGTQLLPSGLILKWGTSPAVSIGTTNQTSATVTFPVPFPHNILAVTATGKSINVTWSIYSQSATSITMKGYGNPGTTSFSYIAIGY